MHLQQLQWEKRLRNGHPDALQSVAVAADKKGNHYFILASELPGYAVNYERGLVPADLLGTASTEEEAKAIAEAHAARQ